MFKRVSSVGNEINDAEQGPTSPAARAVDLTKSYGMGDAVVRALAGVDVEFERGRFTAVMGPSGSGKSTLMHCLAGLDVATSGRAFVGDREIGLLDDADLTDMRRQRIGFVFQSFNLRYSGSNRAIAERLFVTEHTVEKHVKNIFGTLRLPQSPDDHRRVLAVVTHLNSQ